MPTGKSNIENQRKIINLDGIKLDNSDMMKQMAAIFDTLSGFVNIDKITENLSDDFSYADDLDDLLETILRPFPSLHKSKNFPQLNKKFRSVESLVDLSFTKYFSAFLIESIQHYKVDTSNYALTNDTMMNNAVGMDILDRPNLNLHGDIPYMMSGVNMSPGDHQFVILHELRHIMQRNRGWLTYKGDNSYWKGEKCPNIDPTLSEENMINYNKLPYEYDASKFALTSPLRDGPIEQYSNIIELIKSVDKADWTEANG